jgi:hypothetical protein
MLDIVEVDIYVFVVATIHLLGVFRESFREFKCVPFVLWDLGCSDVSLSTLNVGRRLKKIQSDQRA